MNSARLIKKAGLTTQPAEVVEIKISRVKRSKAISLEEQMVRRSINKQRGEKVAVNARKSFNRLFNQVANLNEVVERLEFEEAKYLNERSDAHEVGDDRKIDQCDAALERIKAQIQSLLYTHNG